MNSLQVDIKQAIIIINSFRNVFNIQLNHQLFNLRITHWPQSKTDRSLSELIQTSATAEVISKEERLTTEKPQYIQSHEDTNIPKHVTNSLNCSLYM